VLITPAVNPEGVLDEARPERAADDCPDAADPWARPTSITLAGRRPRPRERGRTGKAAPAAVGPSPAQADWARAPAAPKAARTKPRRRAVTRALAVFPAVLAAALTLAIALPVLLGCRALVVMSGSMEPALPTGSVVLVKRIPAEAIAVGDVVSFRSPENPSRVLTHRVQSVGLVDGRLQVQTRGDANTGTESWNIDPQGTVGRVVFHVPLLGFALAPLQGALPRLLLVVVPALLLAVRLIADIWRSPAGARRRPVGRAPRSVRSGA
jgi:signal peptidase I